jgi:hypothetical protein
MKSFAKSRPPEKALESALRNSAPVSQFPDGLHDSIMRSVRASNRQQATWLSPISLLQRLVRVRWIPLTSFGAVVACVVWLTVRDRPVQNNSIAQPLPNFSTAFSTSRQMVETLPSLAVGPLSDELDKVNQDLDRTTDFLLAALP